MNELPLECVEVFCSNGQFLARISRPNRPRLHANRQRSDYLKVFYLRKLVCAAVEILFHVMTLIREF